MKKFTFKNVAAIGLLASSVLSSAGFGADVKANLKLRDCEQSRAGCQMPTDSINTLIISGDDAENLFFKLPKVDEHFASEESASFGQIIHGAQSDVGNSTIQITCSMQTGSRVLITTCIVKEVKSSLLDLPMLTPFALTALLAKGPASEEDEAGVAVEGQ